MQIILDGSLNFTSVVRDREAAHELTISNAIYDIKPLGDYEGQSRASVQVSLLPLKEILFESEEELLQYRRNNQTTVKAKTTQNM